MSRSVVLRTFYPETGRSRSWLFLGSTLDGSSGRTRELPALENALVCARRLRAYRGRLVWVEAAGQPARDGKQGP